MTSYDIAVWLRSENTWPEITLIVQAETAHDAVIVVLHTRQVHRAVKVAANAGDGRMHRWYGVRTLTDGFDYQHATCFPVGWPDGEQALAGSGESTLHKS